MHDLALINGRIFGGAGWSTPIWSSSLTIKGGKIAKIGNGSDLKSSSANLEQIDLNGAFVLPGLCDAHLHLTVGGQAMQIPSLEGLNLNQVAGLLRNHRKSPDIENSQWITAYNWETWRCKLQATFLEDIFPGRNIVIWAKDLHTCCCSVTVLKRLGVTSETVDPEGGIIDRDDDGVPTGILREAAVKFLTEYSLHPVSAEIERSILRAQDHLISLGLTAVSEVLDKNSAEIYRKLDAENLLKIDIDGWRRIEEWQDGEPPPDDGDRFQVKTLKLFLDGALGSHTAALSEPYIDQPEQAGVLFYSDEELCSKLLPAVNAGWRLAIHAIGDRAVAQAVRVLKRLPRPADAAHRIEHLQILPEDDINSVAESGALASIQPIHLVDDQQWLPKRISDDLCRRTSIWKSLFDRGVPLALGTDWPVACADPRLNIHAAINRAGYGGSPVNCFSSKEGLAPSLAIRAASHGWAIAAGVVERRGNIVTGSSADLTVLSGISDDLEDWENSQIEMVISRGIIVYRRD